MSTGIEVTTTHTIRLNGEVITLTPEQAEDLYDALGKVLNKSLQVPAIPRAPLVDPGFLRPLNPTIGPTLTY